MLSPTTSRVSQNLPTPKCSTCNQFVPLEELGDHICALRSPVPKPALTSAATAALLPKRLQGRTPSPGPRGPLPSTSRSASPIRQPNQNTSQSWGPPESINPLNGSNSPTKVTFQPRPSPLAKAVPSKDIRISIDTSSSMLTAIPQADNLRTRTPALSIASVNQLTPTTARPTPPTARPTPTTARPYFNQDIQPPTPNTQPPLSSGQAISPIRNLPASNRPLLPLGYRGHLPDPSISRSGTPANMVSTGNIIPPRNLGSPAPQKISSSSSTAPGVVILDSPRQSFVPPPERGIDTKTGGEAGMAGVGRRGFAAVARAAMFAHPPGRPLGPQPQRKSNTPKYLDLDAASYPTETPPLSAGSGYSSHSPGPTSPLPQLEFPSQPVVTKSAPSEPATSDAASSITSPLSARFPFFEMFKNKVPGNTATSDFASAANNGSSLNSSTSASGSAVRKNTSGSTFSSRTNSSRRLKDVRRPISPVDSESEYGGLAYADSTDYEDNDSELGRAQSKKGSRPEKPSRSHSNSSSHHYRYPSASEYSENSDRTGIPNSSTRQRPGLSRNASGSSLSSTESFTRDRANSSAIAQALGLSQAPPSDYKKLGGPGVMGIGGRLGRSDSPSSRRNAGPDSRGDMEKALEEAKIKTRTKQPSFGSSSQRSHLLYRTDSDATASSRKDDDVIGSSGSGPKAHRSNTIQSPHPNSPEGKPVKLPMRSLTSPKVERDKALDGTSVKERVRKSKVCLKCRHVIDNGRWVLVDGGGVLCEKCWKNMYLPKCRRCSLSIEKQAVSSSDGQLKGKYHKECFNCDICHKPFPDKTFYVYDGKPLCAYHYHEANDSLCAAARCGQPIEGPCAVSHSGDRYHPEHMTCEYSGYPPCKQMLSEYWEIDGRMLCERHAHSASVHGSDEDEEWAESTRAKKRVTRFIDLAGGIGGSGGGGAELGDSGLM